MKILRDPNGSSGLIELGTSMTVGTGISRLLGQWKEQKLFIWHEISKIYGALLSSIYVQFFCLLQDLIDIKGLSEQKTCHQTFLSVLLAVQQCSQSRLKCSPSLGMKYCPFWFVSGCSQHQNGSYDRNFRKEMYVFMFWENEHQWKLIQNINPQKNNQNHVDRII